MIIGRTAPAHAGRIGAPRGIRAPSARRRAGRAHSRRQGILGTAAATLARDAGAAARYRDGGRTGAGAAARRRRPRSPVAHRRSRHRLRRDSAGAVVRIAGGSGIRHRHLAKPPCKPPQPMPRALGSRSARRSSPAIMRAALSGPFDLIVSNPPYIRSADIAGLAVEVRESRSAGRARWRRRRAGRLSRADSRRRRACWRPARPWSWRPDRAKARQIQALMAAAGLTPAIAAQSRSGGHSAGGRGPQNGPIKSYWNAKKPLGIFARERLRSGSQHRSRVAGPVGIHGWRPEFSKREPAE